MFKSYDANVIKKYLIFTLNIFFYSIIFNLLCFIKTIKLIIMETTIFESGTTRLSCSINETVKCKNIFYSVFRVYNNGFLKVETECYDTAVGSFNINIE